MQCSSCGSLAPDGKCFCADCGAPLPQRCPACGAQSPAGKRFCADCGASFASRRSPAEDGIVTAGTDAHFPGPDRVGQSSPRAAERRQINVLFCDLVGSTALSTELDPEDLRDLINSFHRCAETVV